MKKPFIIPFFLPHSGCPHRCAFCDQNAITGAGNVRPSAERLHLRIDEFLKYKGKRRGRVQVAFYGGNFMGQSWRDMKALLDEAAAFVKSGQVDGIRFSTRPDTVDEPGLDRLERYPVDTVELGVQSMNDHVLALTGRGHASRETRRAVGLLKARGVEIGLQIMAGLPGEDEASLMVSGREAAGLNPHFVRIYPTLVLKNSQLADWCRQGKYRPLGLEEAVDQVKKLYLLFSEHRIPVIRMGLQPSDDLEKPGAVLAGPYHPAFGHLVHSRIFLDKIQEVMDSQTRGADRVSIQVHPRNVSRVRGLGNKNVDIIKSRGRVGSLRVIPNPVLGEDEVRISF